jgi:hypothetical protein
VAHAHTSSESGSNAKSHIILQTGLGLLDGSDCKILVRVLLDTGSERSYVRQKIVDKAALLPIGTEKFAISGFGGESSATQQRSKFNITLAPREGTSNCVDIQAIAVENICAPLHRRSFKQEMKAWSHIKGLFLAEDFPQLVKTYMLIS